MALSLSPRVKQGLVNLGVGILFAYFLYVGFICMLPFDITLASLSPLGLPPEMLSIPYFGPIISSLSDITLYELLTYLIVPTYLARRGYHEDIIHLPWPATQHSFARRRPSFSHIPTPPLSPDHAQDFDASLRRTALENKTRLEQRRGREADEEDSDLPALPTAAIASATPSQPLLGDTSLNTHSVDVQESRTESQDDLYHPPQLSTIITASQPSEIELESPTPAPQQSSRVTTLPTTRSPVVGWRGPTTVSYGGFTITETENDPEPGTNSDDDEDPAAANVTINIAGTTNASAKPKIKARR